MPAPKHNHLVRKMHPPFGSVCRVLFIVLLIWVFSVLRHFTTLVTTKVIVAAAAMAIVSAVRMPAAVIITIMIPIVVVMSKQWPRVFA